MQKLKYFLIGMSFFWIFLWSVLGSLIGAKINLVVVSGVDASWLIGLQKSLITAAHSHMNNMSITLILFALTANYIMNTIPKNVIKTVSFLNMLSIPLFGIGLLLEAFYPPEVHHFSIFSILSTIGAVSYMLTVAVWSSFFLISFYKSR